MSWAEIKKAINSDLNTPLNVLIANTANNPKAVKNVQRGKLAANLEVRTYTDSYMLQSNVARTFYIDIAISSVNTSKSLIFVEEMNGQQYSNVFYTPIAEFVNNTTIRVYMGAYTNSTTAMWLQRGLTWQVIEFY